MTIDEAIGIGIHISERDIRPLSLKEREAIKLGIEAIKGGEMPGRLAKNNMEKEYPLTALEAYEKAIRSAEEAREKATRPIYEAREKAIKSAEEAYEKAIKSAEEAYEKVLERAKNKE